LGARAENVVTIIFIIVVSHGPLYFPVPWIVDGIEKFAPSGREDEEGRVRGVVSFACTSVF
jgi:hypothetical protein